MQRIFLGILGIIEIKRKKIKKMKLHVAFLMAHCKVEELQRIQVALLQLGDKESGIQAKLQPEKSFF